MLQCSGYVISKQPEVPAVLFTELFGCDGLSTEATKDLPRTTRGAPANDLAADSC